MRWLSVGLGLTLLLWGQACVNVTPLAQCFSASDCNAGQTCSPGGICINPPIPPTCSPSCKSDADCGGCGAANTCYQNKCKQLTYQTDTEALTSNKQKVDILFVVDNSGSMREEQEKLARNFQSFIEELIKSDISDFQIGVITTDMDDPAQSGKLQSGAGSPKIINRNQLSSTDVIKAFAENVKVGITGTSYEKPLDAIRAALSPQHLADPKSNKGFLRDGAMLAIVLLTDEDDCSHNGNIRETELDSAVCRMPKEAILRDNNGNPIPDAKGNPVRGHMEELTPTKTYIDFLKSLNRTVYMTGLIGNPNTALKGSQSATPLTCNADAQCAAAPGTKCVYSDPKVQTCGGCRSSDANAVPGYRVFDVMKEFGGEQDWHPICGDDTGFKAALLRAAGGITRYLKSIKLSKTPLAPELIQVTHQLPNAQPKTVTKAPLQGTTCNNSSQCTDSGLCGADGQCYGDGWVLQGLKGDSYIAFSGTARTIAAQGGMVRIKYAIKP